MNILVVSSFLPYPLTSGGHVRLYNLIKLLSKSNEVTLVCEKRKYQTTEDIEEINKICKKVVTVDRAHQWSIKTIIKTGTSLYPFLMVGHTSPMMKIELRNLLMDKKFDVIHVETFYAMQNVPKTYVPIVLVEHNIEYLVYKRFADSAPVFLKPFLYIDVKKIEYWERRYWKEATKLVAVSQEEKEIMGRENVMVVPNGVDTRVFKMQSPESKIKKKEKRILFIGDFKWLQNRDSASLILREIWPKVKFKVEEKHDDISLKLWIVGRNIPDSMKSLSSDSSVIFEENAPDETSEIFKKSYALLAPIRVGGGTSFKILEAMASGVPVITTSLGAEGLRATTGQELLIGDTSDELSDHIITLLHDFKLYGSLAQKAREHVEKNFDWNSIVEKLEEVYKKVVSL